jgi:hypothetical protein
MTEPQTPVVRPAEPSFRQLRQVTVTADGEISAVNELLADGWQLVGIGYRPDATVYVLGRLEERPRHRAGFLAAE